MFAKEDVQFNSTSYSDADLKRVYLKLAMKYHPDRQGGNKLKFQEVQQAFERLKAEKEGFTLSEEDIHRMYTSRQEQPQRQQKSDEEIRKEFEQWKKTMFTEYDQSRHDEFLRDRYYKAHNDFNMHDHFHHPNAEKGPN
jgi:curved DNA-binding protein CbpA